MNLKGLDGDGEFYILCKSMRGLSYREWDQRALSRKITICGHCGQWLGRRGDTNQGMELDSCHDHL